jgi:hypothetical protein
VDAPISETADGRLGHTPTGAGAYPHPSRDIEGPPWAVIPRYVIHRRWAPGRFYPDAGANIHGEHPKLQTSCQQTPFRPISVPHGLARGQTPTRGAVSRSLPRAWWDHSRRHDPNYYDTNATTLNPDIGNRFIQRRPVPTANSQSYALTTIAPLNETASIARPCLYRPTGGKSRPCSGHTANLPRSHLHCVPQ